MLKPRGRGRRADEREVPHWRKVLEEGDADAGTQSARPKRLRDPNDFPSVDTAPISEVSPSTFSGANFSSEITTSTAPDLQEHSKDDADDDDDDVDLSHYDLEANEANEPEPAGVPMPVARVLVSNLAFETTSASLTRFFEGCGQILQIELPQTHRFNRAAHVVFASEADALLAVQKSGSKLEGRRVVVVLAPEDGDFATATQSREDVDKLAIYGYKSVGRGNKFFGTVFADDDARSREKLQKREDKRSGRVGLGQPTGFPQYL
mmetsp:Transcript_53072/g.115858  ORF Transcript_53072/g.115858 Transcript_53072/m.115858 type:complete len:264 (+) Transcript_53072:245-1036(+)|eukprot:6208916-Pleurochrysis_carterae.AAC.6